MSALTQAQVNEILERYEPHQLLATLDRFARRTIAERQRTLRSHKEMPIDNPRDIALRDDLDEFLEMCSALEVLTVATGQVPELESGLRRAIVRILSDAPILQYYNATYRSPLPILLLNQLTNGDDGPAARVTLSARTQSIDPTPLLLSFFEVDARPWRSRDLQFFFDLLDGYQFDGFGLGTFLTLLGKEKLLSRILSGRERSNSHAVRSLNGFCQFAAMCHDLDHLCSRSEKLPMLRSAIWLNFSYWFCERRQYLRHTTREVGARLSRSADAASSFNDLDAHMIDFVRLIDKLTRPDSFAMPLVEASAPLLNDWAAANDLPVPTTLTVKAKVRTGLSRRTRHLVRSRRREESESS